MPSDKNEIAAVSDYLFPQNRPVHPLKTSLFFSVAYFIICTLYIWISSFVAARYAASIPELQHIETIKGVFFILLTTISIFLVLFFLFQRISIDQRKIIDQQKELLKSQREATAGILASSVAHDINNVLIILDHYWGSGSGYEAAYPETREKVQYAINDLKGLAQRLMDIGRGNLPHDFNHFDLPQLIKETIKLIRKHKSFHGSMLEYSGLDSFDIRGNEFTLRQLILNLVLNAAQAIRGKGKIEFICKRESQNAIMEIHDSGTGIPIEDWEKIFEPFYSTREEGTGLGLLSAKVYAEMHKGSISVTESHLGGACFRVEIPLDQENVTLEPQY